MNNQLQTTLIIEAIGKIPPAEYRRRADGTILFRYQAAGESYPGFDERWREVSETEQQQLIQMGGRVAEWLRSPKHK